MISPSARRALLWMDAADDGRLHRDEVHPATRDSLIAKGMCEWVPVNVQGWAGPMWSTHLRITDAGRKAVKG